MFERFRRTLSPRARHAAEIDHWTEVARRAQAGERQFWLSHPRIAHHYFRKGLIEGVAWPQWVVRRLGGPAAEALELGCGTGQALTSLLGQKLFTKAAGLDLDRSLFAATGPQIQFIEADVNTIELEPGRYDLIFALQAFHHFEALERIMDQVHRALKPHGVFVLDEFVGPTRFQWTDEQLASVADLLALIPPSLRRYANGGDKRVEGRSTVAEVIRVSPSEAIRSAEIPEVFRARFRPLAVKELGGTLQHLVYSGIVHNFPDGDPETDRLIDAIDAIETRLIGSGALSSDFMLLVGERRGS